MQDWNEVTYDEGRSSWPLRVLLAGARGVARGCRNVYDYARSKVGYGYGGLRRRWFRSESEGSTMGLLTPEFADGAVLFDGMEHAIIGFGTQFNRPIAIYSYNKMVSRLTDEFTEQCEIIGSAHHDCDHWMEAEEYIEFNTAGGWFGETTPVILREYHG
jgi:hypothetical protein